MFPYSRQFIDKKDINAVKNVLRSNFITQGNQVGIFEKKINQVIKSKYAIAVNSGTSALHIACMSLGLKKGDWLWTVSNSFVASANCGLYCGANIDFVDIDPDTWNISVEQLKAKLHYAKKKNLLPKIIIIVHLAGEPAELLEIKKLSKRYRFKIVEDASHAFGAMYNRKPVGSCSYSDITVFSFHPVKSITTAEGGAACTNNKKIYNKLKLFRNHGITRDPVFLKKKITSHWYYEQICLGFNYRMNEMEAALGISQIKKLSMFLKKRHKIANFYRNKLSHLPIKFQKMNKKNYSSYHLFIVRLNFNRIKSNYKNVFNFLRKNKLGINLHYLPIHNQPYYQKKKKYTKLDETIRYSKTAMSLPIYHSLSKKNMQYIIKTFSKIIQKYTL